MTNKRLFKRIGIDGVGAILVVFLAIVLFRIWNPGGDVWTNDAYVKADYTTIAPQVSGLISQVLVNDNEHVDAGQVLATIDDRDYVVAGRCSPWSPSRKSISMPITLRLTWPMSDPGKPLRYGSIHFPELHCTVLSTASRRQPA